MILCMLWDVMRFFSFTERLMLTKEAPSVARQCVNMSRVSDEGIEVQDRNPGFKSQYPSLTIIDLKKSEYFVSP